HVAAEAVGAERVEPAVHVGRERRQKPRRDDVALRVGVSRRDERRGEGGEGDRRDHGDAEQGATIAEPHHASRTAPRTRGSAQAASRSARRLPATTSTALTAVAAITTG